MPENDLTVREGRVVLWRGDRAVSAWKADVGNPLPWVSNPTLSAILFFSTTGIRHGLLFTRLVLAKEPV